MHHDTARTIEPHGDKVPFAKRMHDALSDALSDGGVTDIPSFSRYASIHGADVALVIENRTKGEIRALAHGFGVIAADEAKLSESERLIRIAMRAFGVTRNDINSDRRTRRIVMAKFFVRYWLYRRTSLSTTSVGRVLGGRDHTTVIYGLRKWPEHRAEARIIRAKIRDGIPLGDAEAKARRGRVRGLIAYAGADAGREGARA